MPASNRRTPQKIDVHPPMSPLPAIVGLTSFALIAYFFAESMFSTNPHGLHWAFAVGGGVLGYAIGAAIAWTLSRLDQ